MVKPVTGIVVIALVAMLVLCTVLDVFGAWGMPGPAQVALAILLIAALLWVSEVIPLFVTSFVILALSVTWLRGTITANGIEADAGEFMAPFFSDIILLFLGGLVLAAALHKYELDERLARRVVDRCGGSVPRLIFAVMCVTAFLSMWLSNTAATAMMLALCLPILRGLPAGDPYRTAFLLAVPFSANVGGLGTPIGSPPNAIAIQYMGELGLAPGFLTWMMMGVPLVLVMLVVTWGLLTVMYRGRAADMLKPGLILTIVGLVLTFTLGRWWWDVAGLFQEKDAFMDIHRQQCQACRSIDLRNILVRETGRPEAVYVRCIACGELVARYELSAYYHHGKGIESWLRSRGIASAESGRDTIAEFEVVQKAAVGGYQLVLAKLEEMGKPV